MEMLEHTCDIYRMASTGQGISKASQLFATNIPCLALPMDNQSSIQNNFDYGQGYTVYFDDGTVILKGDKLQVGALTLIVQGVKVFSGLIDVSHVEVMAQREDA